MKKNDMREFLLRPACGCHTHFPAWQPFLVDLALFGLGFAVGYVLGEPGCSPSFPVMSEKRQTEGQIRAFTRYLDRGCPLDEQYWHEEYEKQYPLPKDARDLEPCEEGGE